MTAPTQPGPGAPPRAGLLGTFRHRDFSLFWTGALVSNVGTWMQAVTVPYVLYQLTHRAVLVGVAAFLSLFPAVFLGPLAGSLADRLSRRRLMLWSQVILAVLALVLWGAWEGGWRSPALLLGIVGVTGAVSGGTMPVWQAFVADLVPRSDLLGAVTLNSVQFNASRAIGPAIGGATLAAFGPSWAFLLNAASFGAVIVAVALVRPSTVAPAATRFSARRVLAEFRDAARYTVAERGILLAVVLITLLSFFATPIFQLLPIVASRMFHVGAGRYGLLAGAFGTGSVLGAGALGLWARAAVRSRIVPVALTVFGAGLLGLAAAPVFVAGLLAVLVIGGGFLGSASTILTSIQVRVDEEMRGRVLALYIMCLSAMLPLGALVQSALSPVIGMRTIAAVDGAVVVAMALVLVGRPVLASALDGSDRLAPADGRPGVGGTTPDVAGRAGVGHAAPGAGAVVPGLVPLAVTEAASVRGESST